MADPTGDIDDVELLRRFSQTRSQAAFAAIVERHVNLVYSTALRRVRDPHLADDVTQAVFLILARRAGHIQRGNLIGPWLYRTTRYAAANVLKAERRRQIHEQEAARMPRKEPRMDAMWETVGPVLENALDALRAGDRQIILLRYFQGRDLSEMGKLLAISENTAAKRLSRAMERLRHALSKRGAEVSTAALGTMLAAETIQTAPAAVASGAVTAGLEGGAPPTLLAIAKGVTFMMGIQKAAVAAGLVLAAVLSMTITIVAVKAAQRSSPRPVAERPPVAAQPAAPDAHPATQPIVEIVPDPVFPQLTWANVPFSDVVEFLKDVSTANFFVDRTALADAKINYNAPINLKLSGAKMSEVLTKVLAEAAPPGALIYTLSDEQVIQITTPEGAKRLARRQPLIRQAKEISPGLRKQMVEFRFGGIRVQEFRINRRGRGEAPGAPPPELPPPTPPATIFNVMQFLGDYAGTPIIANWDDLKAAGIDSQALVSMQLKNVSVAQMLDMALCQVPQPNGELQIQAEEGGVRVVVVPAGK